jgi:hypothetical protein
MGLGFIKNREDGRVWFSKQWTIGLKQCRREEDDV